MDTLIYVEKQTDSGGMQNRAIELVEEFAEQGYEGVYALTDDGCIKVFAEVESTYEYYED